MPGQMNDKDDKKESKRSSTAIAFKWMPSPEVRTEPVVYNIPKPSFVKETDLLPPSPKVAEVHPLPSIETLKHEGRRSQFIQEPKSASPEKIADPEIGVEMLYEDGKMVLNNSLTSPTVENIENESTVAPRRRS